VEHPGGGSVVALTLSPDLLAATPDATGPLFSFISPLALLIFVSPFFILAAIVLDVVAGFRGGPNRVAAVTGGIVLLTPILGPILVISDTMVTMGF
jgi:hypothetical protein